MSNFKIIDKRNNDLIQKINYKENKGSLRGTLFTSSYLFFFFIYATWIGYTKLDKKEVV